MRRESYIRNLALEAQQSALFEWSSSQNGNSRVTARKNTRCSFEIARKILGNNIVFPDEITKARGLFYTDSDIQHFEDTVPSEKTLKWCIRHHYAVVAGPPKPMGLLELRLFDPDTFYVETGGWYEDYTFSSDDKVGCQWLGIRKKIIPDSTNKNWNEQLQLLSNDEKVPNAAELSWFITTLYKVRRVKFFKNVYVRTCSVTAQHRHAVVGLFSKHMLDINGFDDADPFYGLSITASLI